MSKDELNEHTKRRHLRHSCGVRPVQKLRFVVIDVLDLHNKLRLVLHRSVGFAVDRLSAQSIITLLLSVQAFGGMDVPRFLIDSEDRGGSISSQHVPDVSIAFIHI